MSTGTPSSISKAAIRLLTLLADRGPLPHGGDAAETLITNDLAQRRVDGMVEINAAGRAHLARRAFARGGTMDPFLGQHLDGIHGEVRTDDGRRNVIMDAAESPLAWLARRRSRTGRALITPEQVQAGERLRADFTLAQLMPRTTTNWTSSVVQDQRNGGSTFVFTEATIAARQRVRNALEATGPEFAGLLLDVCCFLKGLEDVERERGWPSRSAKVVLQLGLYRLARHYGYGAEARGAARAAIRTWLAPGTEFVLGE
jgi:hypothetical protein